MDNNVLAILIIGTYMFIPLYIGTKAGERDLNTPEDFFIQNREMSSISVFFTVMATWWSAFAFLGSNAYFYSKGPVYWTTIGWDFLFGLLFYVIGKRVWFFGKMNNYITPSDFFRDMYDSEILGDLVAVILLLFTIPYLQIQLAGGAYLIEVASNGLIPLEMGGLIFCVVIIIYVWTGGLRAVAWADIFYGILIILSIILGGIYIVSQVGGMTTLFKILEQTAPEMLTLPGPSGESGYMLWLSMFIVVPVGALMGPQLWTRIYAVKSPEIFDFIPFLIGVVSIINIFPMLIGYSGILLEPNVINADTILPVLLFRHAPFALTSLILTGGAAAAMSTSNSQIHSISSVYTIDIHKKYINKKISNKRLLLVGRMAIVIFSVFTYLMLIFVPGLLINIGLIALSGTAQIIVPTCGALFWEKSNATGAIAGLLGGISVLFAFFILDLNISVDMSGIVALIANLTLFISVSYFTTPRKATILEKVKLQKKLFQQNF